MFLHIPLTVIERHPHLVKDFPSPDEDVPDGVDATVSEGWLDLKVKNNTDLAFQIEISMDETYIYGRIYVDRSIGHRYEVINRGKSYFQKDGKIFERVSVYQQKIDAGSEKTVPEYLLYTDVYEVGYPLPEGTITVKE
jgi:vancomycin resistance protein VanW